MMETESIVMDAAIKDDAAIVCILLIKFYFLLDKNKVKERTIKILELKLNK